MKGSGMAVSRISGISDISRIARMPRISRFGACALALILAGTAVRLAIVLLGYPADDSDEATMGLMALHINTRGEHPIFFYGQNYMGTLEAYLGAAFFRLFGVSVLSLRLSVLLLFALFLAAMYALTSLLYDRRLALITLLLLSLGTKEMIFREIEAAGGYSEVLLFGALALWIAAWLALRAQPDPSPAEWRRRVAAYAALGLAAGLGIWSDWLILPFILTAFALVAIVCGRELRRLPGMALALGLVVGALPLIIFAFQAVATHSAVAATPTAAPSVGAPVVAAPAPAGGAAVGLLRDPSVLAGEIGGTFLISLPNMTGGTAVCPLKAAEAWPLASRSGFPVYACTAVRGAWGLLAVALWVWAVGLAAAVVRRLWRRERLEKWTPMRRRRVALELARLSVLGGAGLTLAAYLAITGAATDPWSNTRYLQGLLIATPAVLWPLYRVRARLWPRARWPRAVVAAVPLPLLRYGAVVIFAGVLLLGTVNVMVGSAGSRNQAREQRDFMDRLAALGVTRVYSEYWTCDRIIFQTQERLTCAVLDEHLAPGQNRYPAYYDVVAADPRASYTFPIRSAQAAAFAERAAHAPDRYRRLEFDGYVVYMPVAPPAK
jgi:hypothetical protein